MNIIPDRIYHQPCGLLEEVPDDSIDVIVTSHQAPPAMVWDLSQLGIQIIQA